MCKELKKRSYREKDELTCWFLYSITVEQYTSLSRTTMNENLDV